MAPSPIQLIPLRLQQEPKAQGPLHFEPLGPGERAWNNPKAKEKVPMWLLQSVGGWKPHKRNVVGTVMYVCWIHTQTCTHRQAYNIYMCAHSQAQPQPPMPLWLPSLEQGEFSPLPVPFPSAPWLSLRQERLRPCLCVMSARMRKQGWVVTPAHISDTTTCGHP